MFNVTRNTECLPPKTRAWLCIYPHTLKKKTLAILSASGPDSVVAEFCESSPRPPPPPPSTASATAYRLAVRGGEGEDVTKGGGGGRVCDGGGGGGR